MGYATQAAMWDRLLNLQPAFFRQYATGDLQDRVMAIDTMLEKLSGTTTQTLFTSFLALLNLALMLYYSWQLASWPVPWRYSASWLRPTRGPASCVRSGPCAS